MVTDQLVEEKMFSAAEQCGTSAIIFEFMGEVVDFILNKRFYDRGFILGIIKKKLGKYYIEKHGINYIEISHDTSSINLEFHW
uniref:Uncharacterized protein n=1 Tax=Marseillevirus LCMAC201 TaxID=2506605 RepID=A0A481YWD0_9VIRU|nr:MAG: hypothetical protein LCMAC201_03390 [Marseillevirus LCMAC201]